MCVCVCVPRLRVQSFTQKRENSWIHTLPKVRWKMKTPRGFELESPYPFPKIIPITTRAPLSLSLTHSLSLSLTHTLSIYIYKYIYRYSYNESLQNPESSSSLTWWWHWLFWDGRWSFARRYTNTISMYNLLGLPYLTTYKTHFFIRHPNFSRSNQEKKIKCNEIDIMNIINNTFYLHNSFLNNDKRYIKVNQKSKLIGVAR